MNAPFRNPELEPEPDPVFVLAPARINPIPVAYQLRGQWWGHFRVIQPGQAL